jgi:hypothetical protein
MRKINLIVIMLLASSMLSWSNNNCIFVTVNGFYDGVLPKNAILDYFEFKIHTTEPILNNDITKQYSVKSFNFTTVVKGKEISINCVGNQLNREAKSIISTLGYGDIIYLTNILIVNGLGQKMDVHNIVLEIY